MDPEHQNKNQTSIDHKRRLLLGFVFIFLFLAFIMSLYLLFTNGTPLKKDPPGVTSPTKFLLHNSVRSLSPLPDSKNVDIYASVSAVFINQITNLSEVNLSINPKIAGKISWHENNKIIVFSPTESFISNNTYEATLIFPNGKQVWRFTIISSNKVSNQDALRNQAESDIKTAESLNEFYIEYPWWEKFPLKKDGYFVYFNPGKKSFVGLLYPKKSSQATIDQEVQLMKSEIEATIKSYSINLLDYGISWKITPEP